VNPRRRRWPPGSALGLDLRLAGAVLVGLLAAGTLLAAWERHDAQRRGDAFLQAQSLGLARYIAGRSAKLLDEQGRLQADGLRDTGMYMSMIHPALEAYLVDGRGRIVAHTLPAPGPARDRISLEPLQALLADPPPRLPIAGDDPRLPGARNLFSVAVLGRGSAPSGYLYVVLRGAGAPSLRGEDAAPTLPAWGGALALALLAGGGVIMAMQRRVTRPLRRLADQLDAFLRHADGPPAQRPLPADEVERVRLAAEALQARVLQQIRQLEDADRLRRELIGNISHDLHTPLANIRGWLETLELQDPQLSSADRLRCLQTASRHCEALARRVAELFELATLEAAQGLAHREPFCLSELLGDVVQAHQLAAERRGVSLRLAVDAAPQARVLADIGLIERVLVNLVDNALRHTPAGGVVELAVVCDANSVRLGVSDDGQGIASADLPHIFERYWTTRAEADADQRPAISAGLGLAIVKRIVDLHGGSIGVQSRLHHGTRFTITLPAG
jgi:two-component system OmpR family sensor kinase